MGQEALGIGFSAHGPVFEAAINAEVRAGLNDAINTLGLRGQGLVQAQLYPSHGVKTGTLRRSIHGGLVRDLTGQIDAGLYQQGENLEYAAYIEGVSSRNRPGGFPGYGMFRQAYSKLQQYDFAALVRRKVTRRFNRE